MKQSKFADKFKELNHTSIHNIEKMVSVLNEISSKLGEEGTKKGIEKRLDVWFENEHLITNADVFWNVASKYFVFLGRGVERTRDSDWLKAWSRYGRMEHNFKKKLVWTNVSQKMTPANVIAMKEFYGVFSVSEQDIKNVSNWFERKGSKQYITVYRGFGVKKGQKVRKGVKRLNNRDALIQDVGSGYSYSLSKCLASGFESGLFKKYFLEKHLGLVKTKNRKELLKKMFSDWQDVRRDHLETSDARSCLGTYRIRKKDIITVILNNQDEVVIEPKNVELVRYDFLTWSEQVGSDFAKRFITYRRINYGEVLRPTHFNQESLLRLGRKLGEVIQDLGAEQDFYNWLIGSPSFIGGVLKTLYDEHLVVDTKGVKFFDRKKNVAGRKEVSTRNQRKVLEHITVGILEQARRMRFGELMRSMPT